MTHQGGIRWPRKVILLSDHELFAAFYCLFGGILPRFEGT